ncbi:MAG: DinB family protein [Bdellovibrionales bacterium]|nr:DinB family protein [Bdellovibrionales bacterium]
MSDTEPKTTEPKLAPPGAGIPWIAKLVLRWYVNPRVAGREPLEQIRARFERKHQRASEEFLAVPEGLREKKVLVPPQRGLEDSSRYWSAAMVLEHLEIVGSQIVRGIEKLANDVDPGIKADTAKVKPRGERTAAEIFASFEKWRAGVLPYLDAHVKSYDSPRTLAHPWFGDLTAKKWFWLLGTHADIHLTQLRAIRKGL